MARRPKTPKVALTYELAPAVEAIARTLIDEHHPHLLSKRILYIFRSRHAKSGRRIVMGRAKIISGLNAFLAMDEYGSAVKENVLGEEVGEAPDPFFLIEIAKDLWMGMDPATRRALVDHELAHCGINGEKICTMPHDVEDFTAIVRRHGLWTPDLAALVKAAGGAQSPLPMSEEVAPKPPALKVEEGGESQKGSH